ncbi:MAG: hypothetical protein AB1490_11030 [Pseudomonadota bacterium]
MLDSVTLLGYTCVTLHKCDRRRRFQRSAAAHNQTASAMMETIPPETVALARRSYAEGVSVSRILAETGISLGTFYAVCDGKFDDGGGAKPAPLPRRRIVMGRRRKAVRAPRVSLVARLWRTAERQVREIETRLDADAQEPEERERDARVLAVLVKTLRELQAFDDAKGKRKSKEKAAQEPVSDDRDIDEFRRDLARKIDQLAAQYSAEGDRGA